MSNERQKLEEVDNNQEKIMNNENIKKELKEIISNRQNYFKDSNCTSSGTMDFKVFKLNFETKRHELFNLIKENHELLGNQVEFNFSQKGDIFKIESKTDDIFKNNTDLQNAKNEEMKKFINDLIMVPALRMNIINSQEQKDMNKTMNENFIYKSPLKWLSEKTGKVMESIGVKKAKHS